MAKRRIEVDIVANDNASSVFRNVRLNASSMSSSLISTLGGAANAMDGLDRGLRSYNNAMYRYNRVVGSVVRTAGDSIYNFTKDAINNFSALEQQHAKTMGAMATEYGKTTQAQQKFLDDSKKLQQQAITLGTVGPTGKGSLYTPDQVSYAQTALVKSGLSADDVLKSGAVESILKFAGGNDLDIDTATQFAVNLGTVFNKPVKEWGTMLDQITKAADISVIDVEDIMDSLTYTGGIASGLGRDLEEVLGVIAVMGQAGLRGRVAGTGLQAFFTRILSAGELGDTAIGNAPSEYVGNMYNAFIAEAVNPDGSFKNMDDVAELLDTAMSELNDQEQAWFAKKLFGLYQMKAAYALTGSVDGDENLITDFINQITNQSQGTNDAKLDIMLESQYGKIEKLKNMWAGTKTDFGARLTPAIGSVTDELFNFLSNPTSYEINWDNLRKSISESGDLISEKYGEELGQVIEDIGDFGINGAQIAGALTPYAGGLVGGLAKLMNGDISGALDEFWQGIQDTNLEIEGLPPELQGTATAAHNALVALTALSGINLVTQIAQPIVTAINTLFGKPIRALTTKVTSTTANVSSANSTVNSSYVGVNTTTASVQAGTATAVNIGQVPLMNVTATVVNVFGGNGFNNPGNGGGNNLPTLPPGGNIPMLPSGGGNLLPWLTGAGGLALGVGGAKVMQGMLGSGTTAQGLLGSGVTNGAMNWYGANSAVINADGTVAARLWNVGGTQMTASQIVKSIATKGLTIAAILGYADMATSPGLFDSKDERIKDANDWLDRYALEGNTDPNNMPGVYEWVRNQSNYNGSNANELLRAEVSGRMAARDEMMSYYKTGAGAEFLNDLFAAQIEENGKITEEFLTSITQWTKDGYTYTGSNEDIKAILDFMYNNFDTDYKDSWTYSGRFNDAAINKFLKNDPTLNAFGITDQSAGVMGGITGVINSVNSMIDRIHAPNINVNVTTNVDKSGNAISKVDINSVSRDVARRSSQYGRVDMMN